MRRGEGLREIRSVPELLDLMERLAAECGERVDATRSTELFEEAVRLTVEIRVPRMPGTDEELARMLRDAARGPTYTMEEVSAHLDACRRRSDEQRREFRSRLSSGRWRDAAAMLQPGEDPMISWESHADVTVHAIGQGHEATVRRGDTVVDCTAQDPGLAVLGVVMRMHRWRNLWMR